jgi:hypothetical protein
VLDEERDAEVIGVDLVAGGLGLRRAVGGER